MMSDDPIWLVSVPQYSPGSRAHIEERLASVMIHILVPSLMVVIALISPVRGFSCLICIQFVEIRREEFGR